MPGAVGAEVSAIKSGDSGDRTNTLERSGTNEIEGGGPTSVGLSLRLSSLVFRISACVFTGGGSTAATYTALGDAFFVVVIVLQRALLGAMVDVSN